MNYSLRFFFEWGCDKALWAGNDAARQHYGVGPIAYDTLNLSSDLQNDLFAMAREYQTAMNWADPAAPSPWSPAQKEDFLSRAHAVYARVLQEIGDTHDIVFSM